MVWEVAVALCVIILLQLVYLAYKSVARPSNFPPGPIGIPFVGSFIYIVKSQHLAMLELSKQYGDVFSVKLGEKNFVCVCGYEANNEVLNHEDICDRRIIYIFQMLKGNDPLGIIHSRFIKRTQAQRKFLLSEVTSQKSAINSARNAVKYLVSGVIREFEALAKSDSPLPITKTLQNVAFKLTIFHVFGIKSDIGEKETSKIVELKRSVFSFLELYRKTTFYLPELFPILQKLWLPESSKQFIEAWNFTLKFIEEQIKTHKADYQPDNPRDLIDLYLNAMESEIVADNSSPKFTEECLVLDIVDVFLASSVSPSVALEFATLYLAGNREIQEKIRSEIDEVLDDETAWSKRSEMHYTLATAYEVFRFANLTPIGVPRNTAKDTTFRGYNIPKGTVFILNSYSVHLQEDRWKTANEFNPENFLDEDGNFCETDAFQPFGGGMRICPGKMLGIELVFTYIVEMVQKFDIAPESDEKPPDFSRVQGLVLKPEPQKVRLTKRAELVGEN